VSRIAGVASSASSALERTEQVLHELRSVFPFDAGMVACVDPASPQRRPMVVHGYSSPFVNYMQSPAWHAEIVEPFGMPRSGWPVRERDLPVDPMTLPGLAEYGRSDGLNEGLLSALFTPDGQYVGFLILSWQHAQPPSDAACTVIGSVAPALANLVDPLQSARQLASTLEADDIAIGFVTDGSVVSLRGEAPPELTAPDAPARHMVYLVRDGPRISVSFLWPKPGGGWYACRTLRCRDRVVVLLARDLDSVYELTKRELEVLTCLADGRSNVEIAARLWITNRTVRAHVEHILEKLGVHTRSAAAARAVGEGLLLPQFAADPDSD
jgi:DNA-binding CsgD family transcriptional regulator